MAEEEDIDHLASTHQLLRRLLPNTWNAFFARFGGVLRQVQIEAIPPIVAGKNTLVTAPTAGGKTEAVMAPVCERLLGNRWPGLSVLLVTPTRALVNDLYERLENPCGDLGIRLGRKTADHHLSSTAAENVLITTPESTESLLTFRREVLNDVHAIVLDEIHLLDGSPRGDQLRILLTRLKSYLDHVRGRSCDLLRVAMSATVPDPGRLSRVYLGPDPTLVSVPGQREIESRIITSDGGDRDRAWAAVEAFKSFGDVRKVLVFVNSRKQVDVGTDHFRHGDFANAPVFGHHGSLAREERERTEQLFKAEPQAICVATMTLEVGIDIGDIDLVVCMDPPFSLSSFLQRIGRGCRRLHGKTRVLCVARDRVGDLLFQALIRQSAFGLPRGPVPPARRSVLLQQVIAYMRQVNKNRRVAEQILHVLVSDANPEVTASMVEGVLADMASSGLLYFERGVYYLASDGWEFVESRKVYSNIRPAPTELSLVDVDTGEVVVTVARIGTDAGGLRVAGHSYSVLASDSEGRVFIRRGGDHADSPAYHAVRLPYAFDIGASLAGFLDIAVDELLAFTNGENNLVVMTWMGKLLNSALTTALNEMGMDAEASAFSITVRRLSADHFLERIKEAVQRLVKRNPFGRLKVEGLVDLGPHQQLLSEPQQVQAREDWLNTKFIAEWAARLQSVRVVARETLLREWLEMLARA